jgi:hypothetical protein
VHGQAGLAVVQRQYAVTRLVADATTRVCRPTPLPLCRLMFAALWPCVAYFLPLAANPPYHSEQPGAKRLRRARHGTLQDGVAQRAPSATSCKAARPAPQPAVGAVSPRPAEKQRGPHTVCTVLHSAWSAAWYPTQSDVRHICRSACAGARLTTTGLLGCLAAHAAVFVLIETGFTHSVAAEVEEVEDREGDGGVEGGAGRGGAGWGGGRGPGGAGVPCGSDDERGRSLLAGMEGTIA